MDTNHAATEGANEQDRQVPAVDEPEHARNQDQAEDDLKGAFDRDDELHVIEQRQQRNAQQGPAEPCHGPGKECEEDDQIGCQQNRQSRCFQSRNWGVDGGSAGVTWALRGQADGASQASTVINPRVK